MCLNKMASGTYGPGISRSSGEMPLFSPGLIAETSGRSLHWIICHDMTLHWERGVQDWHRPILKEEGAAKAGRHPMFTSYLYPRSKSDRMPHLRRHSGDLHVV